MHPTTLQGNSIHTVYVVLNMSMGERLMHIIK